MDLDFWECFGKEKKNSILYYIIEEIQYTIFMFASRQNEGQLLKGKKLFPLIIFFSLKVDLILEGKQTESHKSCPPLKKLALKKTEVYSYTLKPN